MQKQNGPESFFNALGTVMKEMKASQVRHPPNDLKEAGRDFQAAFAEIQKRERAGEIVSPIDPDSQKFMAALQTMGDVSPSTGALFCLQALPRLKADGENAKAVWRELGNDINQLGEKDRLAMLEHALTLREPADSKDGEEDHPEHGLENKAGKNQTSVKEFSPEEIEKIKASGPGLPPAKSNGTGNAPEPFATNSLKATIAGVSTGPDNQKNFVVESPKPGLPENGPLHDLGPGTFIKTADPLSPTPVGDSLQKVTEVEPLIASPSPSANSKDKSNQKDQAPTQKSGPGPAQKPLAVPQQQDIANWSLYFNTLDKVGANDPGAAAESVTKLLTDSGLKTSPWRQNLWDNALVYLGRLSDRRSDNAFEDVKRANNLISRLQDSVSATDPQKIFLDGLAQTNMSVGKTAPDGFRENAQSIAVAVQNGPADSAPVSQPAKAASPPPPKP